jgi:hypothetical protein
LYILTDPWHFGQWAIFVSQGDSIYF